MDDQTRLKTLDKRLIFLDGNEEPDDMFFIGELYFLRRLLKEATQQNDVLSTVCAEAYQVVALLADDAGVFEHPDVIRALDRFAEPLESTDCDLLPWPKSPLLSEEVVALDEVVNAAKQFKDAVDHHEELAITGGLSMRLGDALSRFAAIKRKNNG